MPTNETQPLDQTINRILRQNYFERYPAEAARYLESLPIEDITRALEDKPTRQILNLWDRLSPKIAAQALSRVNESIGVEVLSQLNPNRAAIILAVLPEEQRFAFMQAMDEGVRADLQRALEQTKDSAGSMMVTGLVYYQSDLTVAEAIKKLHLHRRHGLHELFVVDDDHKLLGIIDILELALAKKDTQLRQIMKGLKAYLEETTQREEMVEIFEKYRATELPVVDFRGQLIGIVRHHTLIDAAMEENTLDIQTMVGVSKDEHALSTPSFAVRKRLPWLQVNLATAFLAATVVGFFEDTISQFTALAVLLPVVAGQSGNTGAQALAVTMRGLALREIWPRHWLRMVYKEFSAGFWNGVAVAVTTALGVYIWSRSIGLCLIIGVSMVLSMIIASVSGAMIPILLIKAKQDPATSSSIFLTTVTDVMGFISFLGIATLMIGFL